MLKRFFNRSEIPELVKKNDVLTNINKVKDSLIPFIIFLKEHKTNYNLIFREKKA